METIDTVDKNYKVYDDSSNYHTKCDLNKFPFKTEFSFDVLIEMWEGAFAEKDKIKSTFAEPVLNKLKNIPELNGPIKSIAALKKHEDLVDVLMSVIYPAAEWDRIIQASTRPFSMDTFYSTDLFERIFGKTQEEIYARLDNKPKEMLVGKMLHAYLLILSQCYNINKKLETPLIMGVTDPKTKLKRYFQFKFSPDFIKVKVNGELPELTEEMIDEIFEDITNIDKWVKYLPPEKFEFHGFANISAVNVTDQEIISQLKHDLLERDTIISSDKFSLLQDKMKNLYRQPDLRLGLVAFPKDWNLLYDFAHKLGESFMFNSSQGISCEQAEHSIYGDAIKSGHPLIIENLDECNCISPVEQALLNQGLRSIIIAPLYYENDLVGVLELGSPKPEALNTLNAFKIKGILSLFAVAVNRSIEELESNLQTVIKEECTAIHPSVEWRFRRAAMNLITKRDNDQTAEMEPIVFEKVYPLYGLSDIRNSSTMRNEAIQSDLVEHLRMAKDIVVSASKIKSIPIFDVLGYRIDSYITNIKEGLSSGDELSVIDFLNNEIESTFNLVKGFNSSLKEMIDNYWNILDPNLKSFYEKRKDFEESVAIINETISKHLEDAEVESQKMFPHYFEKYKTDGIEHGIYIGQSMVEEEKFDLIYLKNLRLWQLMVTATIARKLAEIKPFLKIPLDTAHLILIQNSPLSIRFRHDEKKFDVDGTYNIRYEIMKKRIDKAIINGSKERLTQPGKIAMVYSHANEAREYRKYIEYLISTGSLKNNVEDLQLEALQGVSGLKALRVDVNFDFDAKEKIEKEEIKKVVENISESVN